GPLAREERDLVKRLCEFPGVAAEAAERRGPQAIPNYAIRVADDFHRFYHEQKVLGSEAQAFRLGLVRAAQIVIARCLDLVGVEAPERMQARRRTRAARGAGCRRLPFVDPA